jgi:hypothetical protein
VFDRQPKLEWRKSRRCDSSTCVEVAMTDDGIVMRDSKDPDGPTLEFDRREWNAFLTGIRQGDQQ